MSIPSDNACRFTYACYSNKRNNNSKTSAQFFTNPKGLFFNNTISTIGEISVYLFKQQQCITASYYVCKHYQQAVEFQLSNSGASPISEGSVI